MDESGSTELAVPSSINIDALLKSLHDIDSDFENFLGFVLVGPDGSCRVFSKYSCTPNGKLPPTCEA